MVGSGVVDVVVVDVDVVVVDVDVAAVDAVTDWAVVAGLCGGLVVAIDVDVDATALGSMDWSRPPQPVSRPTTMSIARDLNIQPGYDRERLTAN